MNRPEVSNVCKADGQGIGRAVTVLRQGGLVAFPTETVYGLGADATRGEAVAAIFAAKDRPRFNPLIVHVKDVKHAAEFAMLSAIASALAERFWPGALTLVLPRLAECRLSLLVSAGLDTVALRAPAHPAAARLIEAAGLPLAAPSANPSGTVSATTAEHVAHDLRDRVDLILDGGPAPLGVESTIIGFEDGRPALLRPGAIAREDIERITGPLANHHARVISSPGQLPSHYAPRALLRLNAKQAAPGEVLLGFGPDAPAAVANLSASGDLGEAAANLFAMLRRLDAEGAERIAVMPIPTYGLGEAINDRLARAAVPRKGAP